MRAGNGEHGYGVVSKGLHWLTVLVLGAQLTVGYTMEPDAATDRAQERLDAREEACRAGTDASEGAEERCEEAIERIEERLGAADYSVLDGTLGALDVHVLLGVLVLVLAVVRLGWRRTGLPPWAKSLTTAEKQVAHWTERALLLLLFVIPGTGLVLVLGGGDDLLPLHVGSHIAFFTALAVHLGLVIGRRARGRPMLVGRMLGLRTR